MPRALPLPRREEIIKRHQQGEMLKQIAKTSHISYRCVLACWRRYKLNGREGLANHYDRCGPEGPRFPEAMITQALDMKREHPRWGGGLIRVELASLFPDQLLPAVRTLQSWFKKAGLQPVRATQPPVKKDRGCQPHDVWEIDAKEKMYLGDQSGASVLTVTDEASGALLAVAPFPPLSLDAGTALRSAVEPDGSLRALGTAQEDPRGQRSPLGFYRRTAHGDGSMVDRIGHRSDLEPSSLSEGERLRRTL